MDLKRKPVVSMADGTKIGEVDDLVIDLSLWRIVELYVVGKSGRGVISLAGIKSIGPDAITIENSEAVAYNAKASGMGFESLKDLHVVDGTGTRRGHLMDLRYEADGAILSLDASQGGVLGMGAHHLVVTPSDIRGVGDKILTVDLPQG